MSKAHDNGLFILCVAFQYMHFEDFTYISEHILCEKEKHTALLFSLKGMTFGIP